MADRIQLRRDTKANWESYNPILLEGEPGHVLDYPNLYKMGDGIHNWNDLPYRGYNGTVTQNIQNDENSVPSNAAVYAAFNSLRGSGYLYAGSATIDTDPGTPSEKVFYVARNAGTYTNFGNLILTQGINVLKFDGTSWSAEQIIGIDSIPSKGSNNIPESNGVFEFSKLLNNNLKREINYHIEWSERQDELSVVDANGNVAFKLTNVGLAICSLFIKDENSDLVNILSLFDNKVNKDGNKVLSDVNFSFDLNNLLQFFRANIFSSYEDRFIISDKYGNIGLQFKDNLLSIISLLVNNIINNDNSLYITDKYGNVGMQLDKDGLKYPGQVTFDDLPVIPDETSIKNPKLPADINLFMAYGQSNSANGNYPVPKYDFYDALCFASKTINAGQLIDVSDQQEIDTILGGGFASMNEYTSTLYTCGGCVVKWMDKLLSALQIDDYSKLGYQFLPTRGGYVVQIQVLTDPNGIYYPTIIRTVQAMKRYADPLQKTCAVPIMAYIQGEGNYRYNDQYQESQVKEFYDYLWVFLSNINHDIKQITGQEDDLYMFVYQTCQGPKGPCKAMLQLALDSGDGTGYTLDSNAAAYLKQGVELIDRKQFLFSIPFYPYKTHETSASIGSVLHLEWTDGLFNAFGGFFGLEGFRAVNYQEQQVVLHPVSNTITQLGSKYVLEVEFAVPVEPLQLRAYYEDFGNNASQTAVNGIEPNYGFRLSTTEFEGTIQNIIESVSVVRRKFLKIVCSSSPQNLWLQYAHGGSQGGGNLCDSQGTKEKLRIGNKMFIMDNWCPMFSMHIV